jgi:hypothetical protein
VNLAQSAYLSLASLAQLRSHPRHSRSFFFSEIAILPTSELQDMPEGKAFVRTMKVAKGVSRPSGPYADKALTYYRSKI